HVRKPDRNDASICKALLKGFRFNLCPDPFRIFPAKENNDEQRFSLVERPQVFLNVCSKNPMLLVLIVKNLQFVLAEFAEEGICDVSVSPGEREGEIVASFKLDRKEP